MLANKGLRVSLCLVSIGFAGCRACDSRTQVPFKLGKRDAGAAQVAAQSKPAEHPVETSTYPEGTQSIRVNDTLVERPTGTIRASLVRDLDGDGQNDVLIVTTDASGKALLEVMSHGAPNASSQLPLTAYATRSSCRAVGATLAVLSNELGLASVDFLCDLAESPQPTAAAQSPALTASHPQPTAAPAATAEPSALDLAPPEPTPAVSQTHQYVFSLEATPRLLLHLAADWEASGQPLEPELSLTGNDVDGDEHGDVQATLQVANPGGDPIPLTLTWLNRPSGLARERAEPEKTLSDLAKDALRLVDKEPQESAKLAGRALGVQRLLCRESGSARLWVDDVRGVSCGASNAAGKAAVADAIALAKTDALLPALLARDALDQSGFQIDRKSRERVNSAIGAVRGDTSYRWQMGPNLRVLDAPSLHLPALGFIDENMLLLRGPVAQLFDLPAHALTPSGVPGGLLATDPSQHFALTELLHACDGYRVRVAPAGQVVAGVTTGATTTELLSPDPAGDEPGACAGNPRPKSDHGSFSLLGVNAEGALFARGASVYLLAIDAQGHATARSIPSREPISPLLAPGALTQDGKQFVLPTTEGVAIVDRARGSAKLVRTPASCAGGRVSDAAVSPSGRKVAMLCGGHVYLAEPAAESGEQVAGP